MTNSDIQNLVLLELMAPDPYSEHEPILSEEESIAINMRFKEDIKSKNWSYILEPIQNIQTRNKFIELMQKLDEDA